GSLYTLQPGGTDYEVLPATALLHAGWGYWAYFPAGGSLTLGPGQASYSVTLVPDQWVMVGNPGTSGPARIDGADVVSEPGIQVGCGALVRSARAVWVPVPTKPMPTVAATAAAPAAPALPPCPDVGTPPYVAGVGCRVTAQTQATARCLDGSFDYSA